MLGVRTKSLLCIFAFLPIFTCIYTQGSETTTASTAAQGVRVMHVLGLEGVKRNHHGTLTVQPTGLKFEAKGTHGAVAIDSIEDVFTSQDSRQTGGKVLTVAKMGVPYGGGRVLSLFSHEKVDSLTIKYRDTNGALHGLIFSMPVGQADTLKKQLVALGARTSIPVESQPEKKDAGGNK